MKGAAPTPSSDQPLGPDGGQVFLVRRPPHRFRGRPLAAGKELDDYRALLKEGLWRQPSWSGS